MQDVIWLVCNRNGVVKMTKGQPRTSSGEIAVKCVVTVAAAAFRPPVLEREITVADWRDNVDIADIDLKVATITEDEAEQIRESRKARMAEILRNHGWTVAEPGPEEPDASPA